MSVSRWKPAGLIVEGTDKRLVQPIKTTPFPENEGGLAGRFDLCAPRLCRFARALAGGHPAPNKTADDLVQTFMQRTLEAGDSLRLAGARAPSASLCPLVGHTVRGWQRGGWATRRTRRRKIPARAGRAPPAQGALCRLASRQICRCALDLSLEEREALLLVVLEGFDYAQAARILKISRTMLLARLARARAALDEILAPEFVAASRQSAPLLSSRGQMSGSWVPPARASRERGGAAWFCRWRLGSRPV